MCCMFRELRVYMHDVPGIIYYRPTQCVVVAAVSSFLFSLCLLLLQFMQGSTLYVLIMLNVLARVVTYYFNVVVDLLTATYTHNRKEKGHLSPGKTQGVNQLFYDYFSCVCRPTDTVRRDELQRCRIDWIVGLTYPRKRKKPKKREKSQNKKGNLRLFAGATWKKLPAGSWFDWSRLAFRPPPSQAF